MKVLNQIKLNGKDYAVANNVFICYSASSDGTDFTEEWCDGQHYIGVAVGVTAPTDKGDYKWSLMSLPYEIDPLYVRKGGEYTIKAVRENDDVTGAIRVFSADSDGDKDAQVWDGALLREDGTEKMFSFSVTDEQCQYGLVIECTNCTCTMYSTFTAVNEGLRLTIEDIGSELNESKLDKVKTTTAGAVYQNADGTTKIIGVNQYTTAGATIAQRFSDGRIKVGTPKESNDAVDKTYADTFIVEVEKDIPYYAINQDLPTVVGVDRTYLGEKYDIVNIIISGYVNFNDGRACYFNHDITRQVQGIGADGVSTKGSFKMAGICSSNGTDDLSMYDFKIDIVADGNTFKMQAVRLITGTAFEGMKRASGAGNLSNLKVRSILARQIKMA